MSNTSEKKTVGVATLLRVVEKALGVLLILVGLESLVFDAFEPLIVFGRGMLYRPAFLAPFALFLLATVVVNTVCWLGAGLLLFESVREKINEVFEKRRSVRYSRWAFRLIAIALWFVGVLTWTLLQVMTNI